MYRGCSTEDMKVTREPDSAVTPCHSREEGRAGCMWGLGLWVHKVIKGIKQRMVSSNNSYCQETVGRDRDKLRSGVKGLPKLPECTSPLYCCHMKAEWDCSCLNGSRGHSEGSARGDSSPSR